MRYPTSMNPKNFQGFFHRHCAKISEAWPKLSDKDLQEIDGNLDLFLKKVTAFYQVPPEVVLKELDAVQRTIQEGIEGDFSIPLDPTE